MGMNLGRLRKLRRLLWADSGGLCFYCGVLMMRNANENHPRRFTIDHLIPLSKGGTSKRKNLVACCKGCNREKGNKTVREFVSGGKSNER